MKTRLILSAAALAALPFAMPAAADDGGRPINVAMTGAAERPGPGDPDGTGTADIRVEPANGRLCWRLFAQQIDPATAAHIHRGAAGTAGPPVVTLTPPAADGRSEGCAPIDPALAAELTLRGHDFYLNVHNSAFPAGAIRGQLRGGPSRPARLPNGR